MSLTKPIPKEVKERLSNDPFMKECCLYRHGTCEGRIQWHHHLKFAGKRMDEVWGILPLCEWHHNQESILKKELDIIMVSRATYEELKPYCKATDYIAMKMMYDKN